jgi:hypothetical protein
MYVGGFSRRRNRKKLLEELNNQRAQAEMSQIEREVKTSDVVDKAVDKGFPAEVGDLLKMQFSNGFGGFSMPEVPSEDEWRKNELEQLADRFSGSYVELKPDGGFKLWDFTFLLSKAATVEYFNATTTITVGFSEGGSVELQGKTAIAFMRYLHFIGIFEVENAKRSCPDCGDKIPQNCETCGGLGWVID